MNNELKKLIELESTVIDNLHKLSIALSEAVSQRFMAVEHGKNIWRSYLKVSGMDIPKNFRKINQKESKKEE